MLIDDEYTLLSNTLIGISESVKGTPVEKDDKPLDAEGLLLKVYYHASAVALLSHGTPVPSGYTRFLDPASPKVLVRAMLEASLVFGFVFVPKVSELEKDLRYLVWCHSGMLQRKNFTAVSEWAKEQRARDIEMLDDLRKKITDNPHFRVFNKEQQQKILDRGEWRIPTESHEGRLSFPSWSQIAANLGFGNRHAKEVYSFLSGYAHSGYLSVIQIRGANSNADRERLLEGTVGIAKIAMSLTIENYARLFPIARQFLTSNKQMAQVVETWLYIASDIEQ